MLVDVLTTNQLVSKDYINEKMSEHTYYCETLCLTCTEWVKCCRKEETFKN